MQLTYKAASAVATAALCLSIFAPAAMADNTVDISGNGSGSHNHVTITQSSNCSLTQSNDSLVTTDVYSSAKTGGNKANANTGGDVTIDTGNATSTVTVGVTGSSNTATNPCCGCSTASNALSILNNGADSHSRITTTNTNSQTLAQGNLSTIGTGVTSKAKTGKNKADKNTDGSVGITTGNASSTVTVTVGGSSNHL